MAEGVLASSIVHGVLAKIGSSIWAELALLRSFRADLRAMERDFTTVREVLSDAEARGGSGDAGVRDWLRRLRDVAHDIDDLLDECRTDLCVSERRKSTALKSLRRRLESIAAGRDRLRLNPGIQPPGHPSAPPRRETISKVDESKTIGRAGDKEKLMRLVLDATSDEDVSVIPIFGFGGLGKTTLAQLVFNDRRANDEVFDPRIWVSMSGDSSLRTLVQPIVSATKEKCDLDNLDAVSSFLSRTFTGKKYLLVLDDLWSENQEEWERLRLLLKDGKARQQDHSDYTEPEGCHDGSHGGAVRARGSLGRRLLGGIQVQGIRGRGREFASQAGQAAKALGSMLRFNKNEHSWVAVKDSEIWQMEKEETILPSLKLSYDQMAPSVKQCFAYCSVFPRSHEIDRDKLIQQWVALGFIEPTKDEVQTITSNQVNGHTEGCCYVSLADDMGAPEVIQSMFRRVRAFHSWGYNLDIKLVLQSRCLRVLDLGGSPIMELPQMVGKLKHLRYLDVSSSPIETLPNSISSLHNLHTLYLSNCSNLCTLPMSICNLQNLETLNLSACSPQNLPDSIGNLQNLGNLNMSFCNFLETLPNSIGKLQNLRTLNLKGCGKLQSLPDDICSLQNLHFFNLSQCGILQELPRNIGNLSNLYHLNLSQCNDLKSIPDSIRRIRRLHTLNMSHCSSLSEIPVSIGGLKELQFLILSHHSSSLSLPISTGHLPNLQTLDLSWNIGLEELPESIGNLHNLKILILFQCWSLSRLPDSISNLVMLESLNFVGCEQLTKLPDGIISISNLKHLRNDQCSALERLPHGFGQWTKLETLSLLTVGDKNSSIAELEHLNVLTGQLRIECQSPMKDPSTDAMRANLRKKKKLSSLTLSWTRSCSIEELMSAEAFLEVLMPPENLEVFEIDGYLGTKFSSWMMNSMELLLPNLVSISFSNIHHCSCLPHLGHFPHLQSLQLRHITGVHSMDSQMPVKINQGTLYRSLKELHFEDMPNLEIWLTSPVTDHKDKEPDLFKFPVLKTVTVTECPMLTPQPCLPDAIADLSVSGSSSMLSVGRIAVPPSSLLRRLWIKNCHVSSNEWRLLRHRPKLEDLVIEYCERLHVLPEAIRSLTNLRSLKILNCWELKALPECSVNLRHLNLWRYAAVPSWFHCPKVCRA
ncbi:unnamed protein product [Miscanthus lutarioriparius]|uniref:Uncharacterized protein n=1 Tax=Miscanthus lutarioriparius TaxID=422564 RepID=A0A811P7T6_9POAL|nr:unnamed protein product [Miscanthus lutarioriparius]